MNPESSKNIFNLSKQWKIHSMHFFPIFGFLFLWNIFNWFAVARAMAWQCREKAFRPTCTKTGTKSPFDFIGHLMLFIEP
jgi:hypothetical protein